MNIIVVSHGKFAEGIISSAQMILGEQENLKSFGLFPEDDVEQFKDKIDKYIEEIGSENLICFTDLLNGSPFNALISLIGKYEFEHLTGINLPLLLESLILRNIEKSPRDVIKKLMEKSSESIIDVNEFILSKEKNIEEE